MDWLDELNEAQRQAATTNDGPLLIVAGPGTGKTKTLTARIAYLIASGRATSDEILALTFTNKAAAQMRDRIVTLLQAKTLPHISTFHALCHHLLSQDGRQITFISEHERTLLIKQLRKAAELKSLTTRELAFEISRLKNLPPDEDTSSHSLNKLLIAYNQELQRRNIYDFDDLLQQTHALLRQNTPRLPYKYLLVDEFQDTNNLQYELLLLLRTNDNVCAIGDPLQSIYGFRGAGSDIFERFCRDFPANRTVNLTLNYRSTPQVVTLANAVFPHSPQLEPHTTRMGQTGAIKVLNEYTEAAWIISRIEQGIGGSDFLRSHQLGHGTLKNLRTFRDYAILYRTHHVGKTVARALSESGIPFQIIGDGSPYEQPEIWAIMQIIRYLADPTPERRAALDLLAALKDTSQIQQHTLLDTLQSQLPQKVSELASMVAGAFGFDQSNLNQFLSTLVRFDELGLPAYARHIDNLDETNFYEPKADAVTLTTIHAAKGLEFTHVFLIACEEGILPHKRPNGSANTDEERRLFYVAATRARDNLDILHAKTRGGKPAAVSRFIKPFNSSILPQSEDEAMATQQRRQQKRQARRSQSTLFDL